MDDTEGSTMVDGVSPNVKEESQNEEHINNQKESNAQKETGSEGQKEVQTEEGATSTEGKPEGEATVEGEKRTEKGTKLADDPLQQAHQLRANAEAKARKMEEFLSDPKRVKAYLQEIEEEEKKARGTTETTEELIDPDKLETVDDLKKYAKQLKSQTQKEIDAVKKQVGGMVDGERTRATATRIASEVTAVQDKYPTLREFNADGTKNPDYNEELDSAIGQFYNDLDLDPRTGMYRGQYSIQKITERFMKVRGIGEKNGSLKAQTIIRDKRTGRVITNQAGGTDGQPDESKQSASQTIADRMKRAASRTR